MGVKIKTVYYKTCKQRNAIRAKAIKGMKMIGSGAFASVYSGPKSKIVTKVGTLPDKYIHYLQEIVKAPESPFLPVIYEATIYRPAPGTDLKHRNGYERDKGFYVVKMERLAKAYRHKAINVNNVTHMLNRLVGAAADGIKDAILRHISNEFAVPGLAKVSINNDAVKHLTIAVQTMKKAKAKVRDGWWDIHNGNVMIRGKNQVVITDPIA